MLGLVLALVAQPPADPPGKAVFEAHCASCHVEASATPMRAPHIPELKRYKPDDIVAALTIGVMEDMGRSLSDDEISQIATWLTGKAPATAAPPAGKPNP